MFHADKGAVKRSMGSYWKNPTRIKISLKATTRVNEVLTTYEEEERGLVRNVGQGVLNKIEIEK